MKDLLKKILSKNVATPVFVVFGVFAILTFIVFPGLTVASTVINIISALIGIFTCLFVFHYLDVDKLFTKKEEIKPGETELDYLSPDELKPKKKAVKKVAKPTKNKK